MDKQKRALHDICGAIFPVTKGKTEQQLKARDAELAAALLKVRAIARRGLWHELTQEEEKQFARVDALLFEIKEYVHQAKQDYIEAYEGLIGTPDYVDHVIEKLTDINNFLTFNAKAMVDGMTAFDGSDPHGVPDEREELYRDDARWHSVCKCGWDSAGCPSQSAAYKALEHHVTQAMFPTAE